MAVAGHAPELGLSFVFDLTPELARLYGDRPLKDDEPLNVGIVAHPLFREGQARIQEIAPKQILIEAVASR
jgi:hypothetical protein